MNDEGRRTCQCQRHSLFVRQLGKIPGYPLVDEPGERHNTDRKKAAKKEQGDPQDRFGARRISGRQDPLPKVHEDGREFAKLQHGSVPLHRTIARCPGPDDCRRNVMHAVHETQSFGSADEKVGHQIPDKDSRKAGRPAVVKVGDAILVVRQRHSQSNHRRMKEGLDNRVGHGSEGRIEKNGFLSRFQRGDFFLEGRRREFGNQDILGHIVGSINADETRSHSILKGGRKIERKRHGDFGCARKNQVAVIVAEANLKR